MRVFTGSIAAAAVACLALPALGGDDVYRDSGNAAYLAATSRASAGQVRVINARPLTTQRVNTQSTRAIDARRAAEEGYVVRPTSRAYVVTNPMAQRDQPTEEASQAPAADAGAQAAASTQAAAPVDEVVVYEQDRPYPDNYSYDVGNVRAQPSVARAHDGVERADQRAIAYQPRVRYVTRYTPAPDLYVPGSDARPSYRPVTVRVVDPYARYHTYPTYRYGYHPGYSHYRGYGYGYGGHSHHRRHYTRSAFTVGYRYYGDNYSIGVRIGY